MDAYDIFWKIKSLWMQNCDKISGNLSRPEQMKVVIKNGEKYEKVIDVVYNNKINAVEIITEDDNDQEKT